MFVYTHLLLEKEKVQKASKQSDFGPMLDLFPKNMRHFPILFTEEESRYLEGSPLQAELKSCLARAKKMHGAVCKELGEAFKRFSFQDFCEIMAQVNSRALDFQVAGAKVRCLVPLADMFSRRTPHDAEISYSAKDDAVLVTALRDIAKDKEICIKYSGEKMSSAELFLTYGKVYEENL